MSTEEQKSHKNVLELKTAKLAIINFTIPETDLGLPQHLRCCSSPRSASEYRRIIQFTFSSHLRGSAKKFGNIFRNERSRLLPNT